MKRLTLSIAFLLSLTIVGIHGKAVNLAFNKMYSSSTQWSSGYVASKAFDGSVTTRWSTEREVVNVGISNQWLKVDFGVPTLFDRVVMQEYMARVCNFDIQVSDNNNDWITVYTGNHIGYNETVTFESVTKRYFRIFIHFARFAPSFYEVGVYNQEAEVLLPKKGDAMCWDNPRGPLTKQELDYYKAFVGNAKKLPLPTTNIGNQLVYGKQGTAAEGMAWMYKATGDREILDLLIKHCDYMLYCRNDQAGGEKRVIWTGRVEPCWPNKALSESPKYSASENGDILGHIYFCAYLILLSPDLLDLPAPVSDKLVGWGNTYRDRALKFIGMCDEVMEQFYVPNFVTKGFKLCWPDTPEWNELGEAIGYGFPVNQQMMALNAFHKALECYGVLKIKSEKRELYRKIVQTSVNWQAETLKPVTATVNGEKKDCFLWYYHMAGGTKIEDFDHSSYAMLEYYKLHESELFDNVELKKLQTFINTVKYIMYDERTYTVSDHVNGAEKLEGRRETTLPGWIQMSIIDPVFWEYNLNLRGDISSDAGRMGHFLYVKSRLFGTEGFTPQPINITKYGGNDPTEIERTIVDQNRISISCTTRDILYINSSYHIRSVRIVDLSGRTLLKQLFKESIPVSHLSSGIYLVLLEMEEGTVSTHKIVKP